MRVLVTGGAGYIGSIAVERLFAAGHDVVVLDNLWRGHVEAVPADVHLITCDLRDAAATSVAMATAAPDAVLHFAAATLVPESVAQPALYFGVNVVGTHNLLGAMVEHGVGRLVFSSTAAVYGMPTVLPITEEAATAPINPYGRSKLMVEQMLEWYDAVYGIRCASLRYFNVAGATIALGEDHNPETHVIPVALKSVLEERNGFRVFGTDYPTPDGTAIRDYVHVIDLADAHILALNRLAADDRSLGAINLGTQDGFSVKQIIDGVERVTGHPLSIQRGPRRAGDSASLVAESSRALNVLGWTPTRSTLEEMIGSAWDWYKRNPRGYASADRRPAAGPIT
ncbi:MAG: UDP-glucose 4-epimerase GalE [Thermomicrobiales bacterium]